MLCSLCSTTQSNDGVDVNKATPCERLQEARCLCRDCLQPSKTYEALQRSNLACVLTNNCQLCYDHPTWSERAQKPSRGHSPDEWICLPLLPLPSRKLLPHFILNAR